MRVALLYPADFTPPMMPFAALPLLNACAKRAGHQTLVMDVNAEAFSVMLDENNLNLYFDTLDRLTAALKEGEESGLRMLYGYPRDLIREAPKAARDLRNPETFLNPERYRHASRVIRTAHTLFDAMTPRFDTRNENFNEALYAYMARDVSDPYTEVYNNEIAPKLKAFKPDLIAMSCPFSKQIGTAMRLAKCVRKLMPEAKFLIGGTGISDWQDLVLTDRRFYDFIDYAVVGDGEEALNTLLDAIDGKQAFDQVPGLWRKVDGQVIKPTVSRNVDMDQNPIPDYGDIDFAHYMLPERTAFYTTSRGCYYNKCTFCPEGFRVTFRMRSPEQVYADIRDIVLNQNIRNIHFFDPLTPPRTLAYLSREVAREKLPLRWHAEVKFEKIYTSREFVKTLAGGGCKLLQFGFESGVQRVLDAMKKGNNLEQIEIMLRNLKDNDIVVGATWFIGFPTESEDDARETWRFFRRHKDSMHYSLYTGTFGLGHDVPVFQHPEEYGIQVITDVTGNPTYVRNDGKDWDHDPLHRGFILRSDLHMVNSGTALLYAANRPDLIPQLRGVGSVGPVSWEAPPLEERTGWVPSENHVLDLTKRGDAERKYSVYVAQIGASIGADQADIELLEKVGKNGCELGSLISAPDASPDIVARLGRLIDCGLIESAERVPVAGLAS